MKKIIAIVASAALVGCLALVGCSGSSKSSSSSSSAEGAANEAAPASQASSEQSDAKYAVTIDDCQVTTDYSGKSAIVVTYTFTNNSDKATSFMVAIDDAAFQNGVELDTAIVSDIDSQSSMSDIKPGATTTVQQAFLLDDTSDVTVECTELISFNDEVLAEKTFSVA